MNQAINIALHGVEYFLRSSFILCLSRNYPHFMEPEGLLLYLQDHTNFSLS